MRLENILPSPISIREDARSNRLAPIPVHEAPSIGLLMVMEGNAGPERQAAAIATLTARYGEERVSLWLESGAVMNRICDEMDNASPPDLWIGSHDVDVQEMRHRKALEAAQRAYQAAMDDSGGGKTWKK